MKNYGVYYINVATWTKTIITVMVRTISKKHTLMRMELKFVIIVGTQVWKARTPKNSKILHSQEEVETVKDMEKNLK